MMNEQHKRIIERIRALWEEAGGKLLYPLESPGGPNPYHHHASEPGAVEVEFDYGTPSRLRTDLGGYVILGSCIGADSEKFWELFTREFKTAIVRPKRDDEVVRRDDPVAYQCQYSGPLVALLSIPEDATAAPSKS